MMFWYRSLSQTKVNEQNYNLAGQRDINIPTVLYFHLNNPVADLKQPY